MLGKFEDKTLLEIYQKAINSDIKDDKIFDNFILILKKEVERRGLLKDIS